MTTHLSVRLVWHDRAWDGHICSQPYGNSSCIAHEHIRSSREDETEHDGRNCHLSSLKGWLPPCSRDTGAYADRGFRITHQDPLDFRNLPPSQEDIPAYSSCPSPYRWMREENFQNICNQEDLRIRGPEKPREAGWVFEPDRQRDLLRNFWGKLTPGRSLVFYYCNQGNPLDDNSLRVIVGVGRVKEIGPQELFGRKKGYEDDYPIWSRRITQDYPQQGVRIPYQEYIAEGRPTAPILCTVPPSALLAFSYVGEHVSDDIAVAILERVIQSIESVKNDPNPLPGDWDEKLIWLNDVLSEVWSGRGPFPGIGSVLQYLGFAKGTAFHKEVLTKLVREKKNPWEYVKSILEGKSNPPAGTYEKGLLKARDRWLRIPTRHQLLETLTNFELGPSQVDRIADPGQRQLSGIDATEPEIVANPYIISEKDLGSRDSERVALETIDHGMRPEGDARLFLAREDEIADDDRRRVRAVAQYVLKDAATEGDTLLPFGELLDRIRVHFPDRRACKPDAEVILGEIGFYSNVLHVDQDSEPHTVALGNLHELEKLISSTITRKAGKSNTPPKSPIDWQDKLQNEFGRPITEKQRLALSEKEAALNVLFSKRLSVLTGSAGTGKTSVLKVFLDTLDETEGKQGVLLLAPTGKARVRLSTKTGRNAMTIHQLLLKQKWFVPDTFVLKPSSDSVPYAAVTVVIDESSMIPSDFLGTLLKALDNGPLKRLIFVGDPYQLPPIGAGRPFIDILEWLGEKHPDCIAPLSICMRTCEGVDSSDKESVALQMAESYRGETNNPADDELLAMIARGESKGDLQVHFWNDHADLHKKLKLCLGEEYGIKDNDYDSFNRSFSIDTSDWSTSEAEAWQILSATRIDPHGTDELNRLIQLEYKIGLLRKAKSPWSKLPKPFGDQEVVWTDKVIQVQNRSWKAWPHNTGLDYVANGEVGLVRNTQKNPTGDYLDVVFSTQRNVSYRYFRNQVDQYLELGYAITVHKAQGSDFDRVFFVIPQKAVSLSRELLYTGLTRFRKKIVLLIEHDIHPLLQYRNPEFSSTRLRNTNTFKLLLRPEDVGRPHPEALIHRTKKGEAVRSKSEVIVADILASLGISYKYEQPLPSKQDQRDFRLPDFTVSYEGDTYYWEHLGMLAVPSYREAWERKLRWYQLNGYENQLVSSQDKVDGGIDAKEIEETARKRILQER